MKVQTVVLAAHGTWTRAQVCSNECPECGPKREKRRQYSTSYRAVAKARKSR